MRAREPLRWTNLAMKNERFMINPCRILKKSQKGQLGDRVVKTLTFKALRVHSLTTFAGSSAAERHSENPATNLMSA